MHKLVGQIFNAELPRTCPQVAFVVEVALHVAIDAGDGGVGPNIEFPPVDEQRVVDVFLNNASPFLRLGGVNNDLGDFVVVLAHRYALTSVCIFTWLDNPNVVFVSLRILELLLEPLKL